MPSLIRSILAKVELSDCPKRVSIEKDDVA
jgi:hypothetical protein